jgi:hypothetical protein
MEKAVFKSGDNNTFYLVSNNHWSLFLLPSFTHFVLDLVKSDIDIKIFMKFSGAGEILTEILNEKK